MLLLTVKTLGREYLSLFDMLVLSVRTFGFDAILCLGEQDLVLFQDIDGESQHHHSSGCSRGNDFADTESWSLSDFPSRDIDKVGCQITDGVNHGDSKGTRFGIILMNFL